jgi:hypothetical protein
VAQAAGELSQLVSKCGGSIASMTFPEEPRGSARRSGEAHWDTSQLPAALEWVVHFAAGAGAGAGALAFLRSGSRRKMVARLMTLAGLRKIVLKVGSVSI